MSRHAGESTDTPRLSAGSGAAILLYHRVARLDADPQLLAVTPARFERHMVFLRQNAAPMSLAEFIERRSEGRIPDRAVIVTFDDGYADNLTEAKPILERYGVPATVFVAASGLDGEREYWWDDLERLLLATGSELSHPISISVGSIDVGLPVGAYRPRQDDACWNVLKTSEPTPRHAAYRAICEKLRPLSARRRRETIEQIEAALGLSPCVRETHRAMTRDELCLLATGGLLEIGAHTLTHPVLAALPPEDQQREIADGKRALEDAIGMPVHAFSYPYGGHRDYTEETIKLVQAAGFACACANVPGIATVASDPWQLPRMLVRDWSVDDFAPRFEAFWSSHESVAARSAG